jgi:galactokinase
MIHYWIRHGGGFSLHMHTLKEPLVEQSARSMLIDAFEKQFGFGGTIGLARAPGRSNLLGDHTDYNSGLVIPIAVSEQTCVLFRPHPHSRIAVYSELESRLGTSHSRDEFSLTEIVPTTDQDLLWSNYIRGIAAAFLRRGITLKGGDLYITSSIPEGGGLSSSAALEIASGLALLAITEVSMDSQELAFAAQEAENTFAGVRSGIMDQTVVARALAGCALLLDCRSMEVRNIPIALPGYSFALFDTGIRHKLASSEYNKRRSECESAASKMQEASLRDISLDHLLKFSSKLTANENKRVRHVITENQRVAQFAAALIHSDIAEIGRLLSLSHSSLQSDYEVSCPELDEIVNGIAELNQLDNACPGGRMTGGGFGGSVVALLQTSRFAHYSKMLAPLAKGGSRLITPSTGATLSML